MLALLELGLKWDLIALILFILLKLFLIFLLLFFLFFILFFDGLNLWVTFIDEFLEFMRLSSLILREAVLISHFIDVMRRLYRWTWQRFGVFFLFLIGVHVLQGDDLGNVVWCVVASAMRDFGGNRCKLMRHLFLVFTGQLVKMVFQIKPRLSRFLLFYKGLHFGIHIIFVFFICSTFLFFYCFWWVLVFYLGNFLQGFFLLTFDGFNLLQKLFGLFHALLHEIFDFFFMFTMLYKFLHFFLNLLVLLQNLTTTISFHFILLCMFVCFYYFQWWLLRLISCLLCQIRSDRII